MALTIVLLLVSPLETLAQDSLDVWLDKLAAAECRKCPLNKKVLDVNYRYSYGQFQFQKATFIYQATKYGFLLKYPNADPLEAAAYDEDVMELIYDYSFQKKLVRAMFLKDPYAWRHWQYSVRKIGVCPPVQISTCVL